MTAFLTRRTQVHQNHLMEKVQAGRLETIRTLQGLQRWFHAKGNDSYTASRKALGALYGMVQRHATMLSFVEAFWIMAILFVAMLPLLLLLRRRKVPTRALAQPAEVSPEPVLMEKPSDEEKEEEPALVH